MPRHNFNLPSTFVSPRTVLREMPTINSCGKLLLALSFFGILGCNSGHGGSSTFEGDYGGVWDVRYNLRVDECQLVESGLQGFVDTHVIDQQSLAVQVQSTLSGAEELTGSVDESQKLTASQTISGDIFGDGIFCEQTVTLSYEPQEEDSAQTIIVERVLCDDGYGCESEGIGTATRRR